VAWNEPTPGGDKDPWGRKRDQGPPDLDQIFRNLRDKIGGIFGGRKRPGGPGHGGNGASGVGMGLIAFVIVALWLLSGFYIVQQGENAVVLRFGAQHQITGPGLHWNWPFPIERREIVNVEKVSVVELGYRRADKGGAVRVPKEALMLTQDENIISIEFAIQYRVKDAAAYLFNVRDQMQTISQAAESAVREVVGKNTLDFALTSGRDEVEIAIKTILQEMLDRYRAGIEIASVEMQEALPPEQVRVAFDDVVKAREDEQRKKNEAEAYFNDKVPRARGEAARLLQEAQGYKAAVIARAEGDARRFTQIATEYAKAPSVTRERMYIETMEEILSNVTKIYVDQKSGNMLYLPLDKLGPAGIVPPARQEPQFENAPEAAPSPSPADVLRGRDQLRTR